MLKAILLGISLAAFAGNAHSQQPSPSAREIVSPNQDRSGASQKAAAEDKRGTKNAPLVIEMTNPPSGDEIAAEIKKNRTDQSAEDGRSHVFNSLLVAIGFLQAIALLVTVFVTNKAASAAKDAAESLPRVERAYLIGGVPDNQTTFSDGRAKITVIIAVQNHGKTPGFLEKTYGEILPAAPTVPPDKYPFRPENTHTYDLVYSAGAPIRPLEGQPFVGDYYLPATFFIGFVKYRTIFDERVHTSYWCIKMHRSESKAEWAFAEAPGWNSYD